MMRSNDLGKFASPLAVLILTCTSLAVPATLSADEGIEIAPYTQEDPVSFQKQVLPVLRSKCIACHNSTVPESELVLETPEAIAKGGSEGTIVVPGKADESRLLKIAARVMEPMMPPEDNDVGAKNLTPEELGLLKLWIEQGAKGDAAAAAEQLSWQPLPDGVNPVYTVAVTRDGQYAAAGRANQVFLYHLPSKREIGRLTDPHLIGGPLYSKPGVAHLDIVQSLAFHPRGDVLASGGFRTVKLWRRAEEKVEATIEGPESAVRALAVSDDGRRVALGLESGTVRVLDPSDGKTIVELQGHDGPVLALRFAPDGRLVSGGQDKTWRVWDVARGQAAQPAVTTPATVNAIALVGDGKLVATGGDDNVIRTWTLDPPPATSAEGSNDAASQQNPDPEKQETQEQDASDQENGDAVAKPVKEYSGSGGAITSLTAIGSAGSQLVSGSQDGSVRVWDVEGGNQVRQMNHGAPVVSVAASADGDRVASAADNTLKLWNGENGQQVSEMKGDFRRYLVVGALDRAVELAKKKVTQANQDLEEANKRKKAEEENAKKAEESRKQAEEELNKKTEATKKPIADKEAADKALADATEALTKGEAEKKAAEETFAKSEERLKLARQEQQNAEKAVGDATAAVEQARQSETRAREAAEQDQENQELAAAVVAAAKATADAVEKQRQAEADKAAKDKAAAEADAERQEAEKRKNETAKAIGDLENQRKQAEENAKKATEPVQKAEDERKAAERAHQAAERAVERANDAVAMATEKVPMAEAVVESAEQRQSRMSGELDESKKRAGEGEKPFLDLAFSADGRTLAAVGESSGVHTFDAETGEALEVFARQQTPLQRVEFTAADKVITVAADNSVLIGDARVRWELDRVIGGVDRPELEDRVIALDFSSDGALLATGAGEPSRSGQIKIWNVSSGELVREIAEPHSDTVFGLRFSPDDSQLVSCAADRFVKIFDLGDGSFVRAFEGHTHHVLGVSWSADGRTIASSGADKVIKIWDVRTGEQKKTITGFDKEVTSVRFLGNGEEMVASSGDKSVRMKRPDGGDIRSLSGGQDFMFSVDVSADGNMIVAGGQDSVVRVWSNDGKNYATFEPRKPADE